MHRLKHFSTKNRVRDTDDLVDKDNMEDHLKFEEMLSRCTTPTLVPHPTQANAYYEVDFITNTQINIDYVIETEPMWHALIKQLLAQISCNLRYYYL
jgi:hypothetical protein